MKRSIRLSLGTVPLQFECNYPDLFAVVPKWLLNMTVKTFRSWSKSRAVGCEGLDVRDEECLCRPSVAQL